MSSISALQASLRECYQKGEVDYYLKPLVHVVDGQPVGRIGNGDTLFFCCRRGDRQVQLTEALVDPEFNHFQTESMLDLTVVTLVQFTDKFSHLPTIFPLVRPEETLGEVLSKAGVKQTRVAEKEKAAHVTFFFNGRRIEPYEGEEWVILPSPHSSEFLKKPATSTALVAEEVEKSMERQSAAEGKHFIVANLAAGDIIGHLDDWEANISCAEAVDRALGAICAAAAKHSYLVAVTADHGLLERFFNEDRSVNLSHTTSRVPFALIPPEGGPAVELEVSPEATLADVAPTVLSLMGIAVPDSMDGVSRARVQGTYERVVLVIADGWGVGSPDRDKNPIAAANTPNMDGLVKEGRYMTLAAAGFAVGLPEGRAGNSETGHLTLGAGRVVLQDELRIARALATGELRDNEAVRFGLEKARENGGEIHVLTMLTTKSSHGNMDEGLAVLRAAAEQGWKRAWLHLILDGRSSPPQGGADLLDVLRSRLPQGIEVEVVTAIGRGYALDRSGGYTDKTKLAYEALIKGNGRSF